MSDNLKKQTINGLIWSFVERFGSMIFQFVSNIVLARILLPNDFGLVGMIMVFVAISNTLIDSGFSSALIQKKEVTEDDYSTVFYTNLVLSLLFFMLIYISAPFISKFYSQPKLTLLLRILGSTLIINSLSIIHNVILIRKLDFKKIAKVNVVSTFLACGLAIIAARLEFGVWSLIIQTLSIAFFRSTFLWIWHSWKPRLVFSYISIKSLLSFGYKLLFASLLDTVYTNIQLLVIGKVFSPRDLGYYSQASKMSDLPSLTLAGVITQVTFPAFSRLQDQVSLMKLAVRKSLKLLVFVNFPLMVILILIAKPLFFFLFTNKWDNAVPYFQILCLSGMLLTSHITNLNILKATGRSDVFFILEIVKKIIGVLGIVIGIQFGIIGMLLAIVIVSYFCLGLNAFFSGKIINYGIIEQIKDALPTYLLSIIVGLTTFLIFKHFTFVPLITIASITIFYSVIFLFLSKILKFEAMQLIYTTMMDLFSKIKSFNTKL